MRVQHNIAALNANRNLSGNNSKVSKSLEKLSSGYRINRAGDDAAGLAISEKMRSQISGLTQAETNANDGISLIQTAEGALTETHSILNRMKELAVQSSNGTYQDADRTNIQDEINALNAEIDRIADSTKFNGIALLDGTLGQTTGNTTSTIANGASLGGKFVVTKYAGASISTKESIAIEVGAGTPPASSILVTSTNTDGSAKTTVIDLKKAVTYTNGTKAGKTLAESSSVAVGDTLRIDLSTAGLGVMEITAKTAGGTATEIAAALKAGISGTGVNANPGSSGTGLTFQIGSEADGFQRVTLSVKDMGADALGVKTLDLSSQDSSISAITDIDNAIVSVAKERSNLGALQNRLEHTINNLSTTNENLTAAESRIRDTDMAKEMMDYTKNNILSQAAQSMLAQANQQPQQVLSLLQ